MKKIFLLTILSLVFLSFCSKNNRQVLLKVGSQKCGLADFYEFIPAHRFKPLNDNEKKDKINQFVDRQLIVTDAIKKGYLSDSTLQRNLKNYEYKLLFNLFFDRNLLDTIITTNQLLDLYSKIPLSMKDMFTFDEYRPVLLEQAMQTNNKRIRSGYLDYLQIIQDSTHFALIDTSINKLAQEYSKKLTEYQNSNQKQPSETDILRTINFQEPIYIVNNATYGVPDLLKMISLYPYLIPNDLSEVAVLSSNIKSIYINYYVINKAYEQKIDQSNEYKTRLANQKYLQLANIYEQREIDNLIGTDTDTLKSYYEKIKDKAYMSSPTYEVHEIYIKNKQKAERILNLAKKNSDFKSLSDKNTERFQDRPAKGYLGFIRENQYSRIGTAAKNTKAGTVYPDLIPFGNGYSIIKVISVKEAEPIPFDNIVVRVRSDYKNDRHKQLKEKILKEIKNKYHYKLNTALLIQNPEVTNN
jgi:hypothetical protein